MTKYLFASIGLASVLLLSACSTSKKSSTPVGDNSMNALDWPGTYTGVTPCADCEGIETRLTLKKDMQYILTRTYVGKSQTPQTSQGKFSWNAAGSSIQLENENPGKIQVGENQLFLLDQNGNRITGNLASKYTLQKTNMDIADKYWKLIEINGKAVGSSDKNMKEPHIILRAEDMRFSANGGCNNMMGSFSLPGMNRIQFGKAAATMMACPDMTLERELAEVLERADNYAINNGQLSLNKARMAPLARFVEVKK